jgi:hypothetical protein
VNKPVTDRMLQWFAYQHLPEHLQKVSRPFGELAQTIVEVLPQNAERTVALRKLLEAKDCAVRSLIEKPVETSVVEVKKEETWLDRVKQEYQENLQRFEKLDTFIKGPNFPQLPWADRQDLHDQHFFMEGYKIVLDRRLAKQGFGTV